MRRAGGELLMSAAALAVLLLTIVAVDDRVLNQIAPRMSTTRTSAELVGAGVQVRDLAGVVFEAVRDQSIEHTPLVIFVLAAVVLTLFMLRT